MIRFKPWSVLLVVASLAYPALLYAASGHFEPRHLAPMLAGLALLRALLARQRFWWFVAAGAALLAFLSAHANALWPLKLYPVLVNAVFLALFALSLFHPPSAVERLARMTEPDFPPAAVAYTRRVTQAWCLFFFFNGSVAMVTALWASDEVWAFYNGCLTYVLMGLLFAIEWCVRRRVRARIALNETRAHG